MANRIAKQLKKAGEEIQILRNGTVITEYHLIKLNKQKNLEQSMNILYGLFHSDTQIEAGDIVRLPLRKTINNVYFAEGVPQPLNTEGESVIYQVVLRRVNGFLFKVVYSEDESEGMQLSSLENHSLPDYSIDLQTQTYCFIQTDIERLDIGGSKTLDTDLVYIYVPIASDYHKGDRVGIRPLSTRGGDDLLRYYQITHTDYVDFPNMMRLKVKTTSMVKG